MYCNHMPSSPMTVGPVPGLYITHDFLPFQRTLTREGKIKQYWKKLTILNFYGNIFIVEKMLLASLSVLQSAGFPF